MVIPTTGVKTRKSKD